MRVLKTKIGSIQNIEDRVAFMRNKVEFHEKKKNGKKSIVVSIESIPPVFLPVCYCYLYISVVEYTH